MADDAYTIRILKRAQKDLAALPQKDRRRVARKIDALANNPTPRGSVALKGELEGYRRVRVGTYRIIYTIEHGELVVVVVRVAHRRKVYR